MSDDLDLRGIDQRHEPAPQFRAALQRRVAAIVAGTDPGSVTQARDQATIDLEPTTAKPAPSRIRRRFVAAVLAAAAAVAAIAVVAARHDDATPADQPSPSVTGPPRALSDSDGDLEPGTYYVDDVDGTPTPRIVVTIGAGWRDISGDGTALAMGGADPIRGVEDADLGALGFSRPPSAVFADACHWKDGYYPGSVDTVDGLVAALTEQQGWAEVNRPSGITVDGYVGKRVRRIAPADVSDCDTMPMNYSPRIRPNHVPPYEAFRSSERGGGYQPGEIEILWVLDIDGTVVVISTTQWVPTAAARDDFAKVLNSIHIERRSPVVTAAPTTPPGSVGNPLVDIRSRLDDQDDVELFRIESDTESYWRLTTLPEFDGRTFQLPSSALAVVDEADGGRVGVRQTRQQIEILGLEGTMIPAAADIYQVAPSQDVRLNPDTGTLLKVTDLVPREQFTIVSVEPDITVDELRAATTNSPPDEIFLGLPDNVPQDVYDTAAQVTAGATTDYDRLIALQDWFRNNFEYSTDVQSGHGNDAIENFLQTRKGYCEHFAATFAVMARTLGIPSRVAVGYTPGQLRSDGWYSVTGRNSHAWPEVWFDGIGWIPFEPTPQRGIPGADYTGVAPQQDTSPAP